MNTNGARLALTIFMIVSIGIALAIAASSIPGSGCGAPIERTAIAYVDGDPVSVAIPARC